MSIALMTLAFKCEAPATQKLVLLALCDSANDQGECYPSIPTLARKCSMGERTVQEAIAALEAAGGLRREFRSGRATVYWMTPESYSQPPQIAHPRRLRTPQQPHHTPADCAPPPPQIAHHTPADCAPITIKETSIEPSRKRKDVGLEDVTPEVAADFKALRTAKKAPLTATAIAGIRREAVKAGLSMQQALETCCQRGWTGFKADWVKDTARGGKSFREQSEEFARAQFAGWAGSALKSHAIESEAEDVPRLTLG